MYTIYIYIFHFLSLTIFLRGRFFGWDLFKYLLVELLGFFKHPEFLHNMLKNSKDNGLAFSPSEVFHTLRVQVCPKKGITPTIVGMGCFDHQSYSRQGFWILKETSFEKRYLTEMDDYTTSLFFDIEITIGRFSRIPMKQLVCLM